MLGIRLGTRTPLRLGLAGIVVAALALGAPRPVEAHDVRLQLQELNQGADRVRRTLDHLRAAPALPPPPRTVDEHRRVLGAAEVELALDHQDRALQMLVGRIADPSFEAVPEYVDTLLLGSELLEARGEDVGAMLYAGRAAELGRRPEQVAEAAARWFRLARRHQRLDGRVAIYEAFKRGGGVAASDPELAAVAAYESAFALRAARRHAEAQALLARVPSGSRYGSRAAYLAGVLFVESGDLASAERWFGAVMDWDLPAVGDDAAWRSMEEEVRELAALSAGRLRYERGDLEGAAAAYARIGDGSPRQREACYERIFLEMERKRMRGALRWLQCVQDLGAGGQRYVDVSLTRASMLAHFGRYGESVSSYEQAEGKLRRLADVTHRAVASIEAPGRFLFEGMERNALTQGRQATAGPPVVFGDAWTPTIDTAYRLDRDLDASADGLDALREELEGLAELVAGDELFPSLEMRRRHYKILLRDIQHLQGHASDVAMGLRHRHADASGAAPSHDGDGDVARRIEDDLARSAHLVEAELMAVDDEERRRVGEARAMVAGLQAEVGGLIDEVTALEVEVEAVTDRAAREALDQVVAELRRGVMRARVGVLDTFWLRKEHVSRDIRTLGTQKAALDDAFTQAEKQMAEELDAEAESEAP